MRGIFVELISSPILDDFGISTFILFLQVVTIFLAGKPVLIPVALGIPYEDSHQDMERFHEYTSYVLPCFRFGRLTYAPHSASPTSLSIHTTPSPLQNHHILHIIYHRSDHIQAQGKTVTALQYYSKNNNSAYVRSSIQPAAQGI